MKEKPIQDGYWDKTDKDSSSSTRHRVSLPGCVHIPTIMNWRWRALAQKIDPAMLANTVTEYLRPKIELGLLFAYGISDQMCRIWTRTIIDTLAATANMTKTITRLMSVEATCYLAGIPDIGLRM